MAWVSHVWLHLCQYITVAGLEVCVLLGVVLVVLVTYFLFKAFKRKVCSKLGKQTGTIREKMKKNTNDYAIIGLLLYRCF